MIDQLDESVRVLAAEMVDNTLKIKLFELKKQLLHTDPRLGNTLFRDDEVFTFIDFDGVRKDNPLIDTGDMLQSIINEFDEVGGQITIADLHEILCVYHDNGALSLSKEELIHHSLEAAKLLALNLGARHLIDTVEDKYYLHDPARFRSRVDFNLYAGWRQQRVYQLLCS
jgi:Ser/Thr protein kinase RdoA (MazF antagonist)